MSEYTPDQWVVIEITAPNGEQIRRVLAGWYGGFARSNEWRMNSGIKEVVEHGTHYEFKGYSGSTYYCYKNAYGMSMLMQDVFSNLEHQHGDNIKLVEGYNETF